MPDSHFGGDSSSSTCLLSAKAMRRTIESPACKGLGHCPDLRPSASTAMPVGAAACLRGELELEKAEDAAGGGGGGSLGTSGTTKRNAPYMIKSLHKNNA